MFVLHLIIYLIFHHYRYDIVKYHTKNVDKDDDEWEVFPKANTSHEACIIHCTKSKEKLTYLPSIESWLSLLDTASTCQHQAILDIAVLMEEGLTFAVPQEVLQLN